MGSRGDRVQLQRFSLGSAAAFAEADCRIVCRYRLAKLPMISVIIYTPRAKLPIPMRSLLPWIRVKSDSGTTAGKKP